MIRHIRILIVDEDVYLVEGLGRYLRKRGYSVEACSNMAEGIGALRCGAFDLFVCRAPANGENGKGVLSQARALRPDMGILLITGKGRRLSPSAARKAGADGTVAKPFSLSSFSLALERAYWRALSRQDESEEAGDGIE